MIDYETLFKRHSAPEMVAGKTSYINYFGVETDVKAFPQGQSLVGTMQSDPPLPDDGMYGGALEYAAILEAIEHAQRIGAKSFAAAELGAGWGPWISLAGVVANRTGAFESIGLVGVEADDYRFPAFVEHMKANGCYEDGFDTRLHEAAVWHEGRTLKFPYVGDGDHGGGASVDDQEYRGLEVEMRDVQAVTLPQICGHLPIIDVMHWDVQGAEFDIARHAMRFLNQRARSLLIGTHSRVIEGQLLELFWDHGWDVIEQAPCAYFYSTDAPSVVAMTHTDGEFYVRNPRLWHGH